MPHTSHRKKQQRDKRAEVTDENGWTRVTTTNSAQRAPRSLPASDTLSQRESHPNHVASYSRQPSVPVTKSRLEQVERQYREVEKRWLSSISWARLQEILTTKIAKETLQSIDKCVVFGTGSYCGHIDGWIERFEVSMYQLAAFKAVIDTIASTTGKQPLAYAQEPSYNELDVQLLMKLGIEKVDHPTGFQHITPCTFTYAPAAELSVEMRTLAANPAIAMITGGLDFFWRNPRGEACTSRMLSTSGSVFGPLEELSEAEEIQKDEGQTTRDEIEKGLSVLEEFKQGRDGYVIPDLDVKDAPFRDTHLVQGALKADNLDFDARVPIPISVFPSTYRSDATAEQTTTTKVEGEINLPPQSSSRVGREDTRFSGKEEVEVSVNKQYRPDRQDNVQVREDIHVYQDKDKQTRFEDNRYPQIDITRERYQGQAPVDYQKDVNLDITVERDQGARYADVAYDRQAIRDTTFQDQLDITEREYRRRVQPTFDVEYERVRPSQETEVVIEKQKYTTEKPKVKMGYYDDEGQYHSFRRGVGRAVDHIVHPFSHHHHHESANVNVNIEEGGAGEQGGARETVRIVQRPGGSSPNTVTIPCHFIRIGDLVILQGRPCQIIRISTSAHTGQYRYLGVDLFTRQLHEESSFVSNPEPSVVVQSMVGPVFKQYRILDIAESGTLVCMTETGDVKQGLPVVDQGGLFNKISSAFRGGRGSVRALVINDGGRELIVDYKVIHGSRL